MSVNLQNRYASCIPANILFGEDHRFTRASCKEEISTLLTLLHPLAQIAPLDWLRILAGKIPTELTQMFTSAEPAFVRAMCVAIFNWEGLGSSTTKVIRLHGSHDFVIPPPKTVALLIDGGHLISMSHAAECAAFIMGDSGGSESVMLSVDAKMSV